MKHFQCLAVGAGKMRIAVALDINRGIAEATVT